MVEKLEWDTEFFGYEIGKFTQLDNSPFQLESFMDQAKKFKLVYLFSEFDIVPAKSLLFMEKKVTFQKTLRPIGSGSSEIKLYQSGLDSFEELQQLAFISGRYSRYKLDSNFTTNEFQKLYSAWIKKEEIDILIYKDDHKIVGFITVEKVDINLSRVGLIAVDPKHQRKGIAQKLVAEAEILSMEKGNFQMHISTQSQNTAAMNFYKKNGYTIHSIVNIYHYWNL